VVQPAAPGVGLQAGAPVSSRAGPPALELEHRAGELRRPGGWASEPRPRPRTGVLVAWACAPRSRLHHPPPLARQRHAQRRAGSSQSGVSVSHWVPPVTPAAAPPPPPSRAPAQQPSGRPWWRVRVGVGEAGGGGVPGVFGRGGGGGWGGGGAGRVVTPVPRRPCRQRHLVVSGKRARRRRRRRRRRGSSSRPGVVH